MGTRTFAGENARCLAKDQYTKKRKKKRKERKKLEITKHTSAMVKGFIAYIVRVPQSSDIGQTTTAYPIIDDSCVEVRGQPRVAFFSHYPTCFLRQSLSLAWSLPSRLGWLASKPQGSTCLCLPSSGITSTHHCRFWRFKSSTLLMELYPQPL